MEELTVRLICDGPGDGPHNMAADEVLLQSAAGGIASLRFYTWERPTLSIGYFQQESDRLKDPLLAELPFVRRASAGLAIVHHHELTYCLAIPSAQPWREGRGWLHMHEIIAAALVDHGVRVVSHVPEGEHTSQDFLCFHHFTAGDLMIGSAKVVGSAQRKQQGALMQHGSVLLERSRYTPTLGSIRELTQVFIEPDVLAASIVRHTKEEVGWNVEKGACTAEEQQAIHDLAESRYRGDAWNQKR